MTSFENSASSAKAKKRWRFALWAVLALPFIAVAGLLFHNPDPVTPEPSARQYAAAEALLKLPAAQLPPGWKWQSIDIGNKRRVRYGMAVGTTKVIAVYVPGFTSMVEQYAPVLSALHAKDISVVGMDLPGQGGSSRLVAHPQKAWVDDFEVYAGSIRAVILRLRSEYPGQKIILIGESLGGHSALRASMAQPKLADALILVAPALHVSTGGFPRWLAKAVADAKTATGSGKEWGFGQGPRHFNMADPVHACGADPKRMELYHAWNIMKRDQRVGGATNEWVSSLFRSEAMIEQAGNFSSVHAPVLLISPGNDRFTDPTYNEALCSRSKNCRAITLPRARHCPWFDPSPQPEQLIDQTTAFIDDIFKQ
jgi:lysophospholipase